MTQPSSPAARKNEIVLHLGAHKTATTYLQSRLAGSADTLREQGVYFIRTGELRKKLLHVRRPDFLPNKIPMVRSWRTAGVYREYMRDAANWESQRVVVSEENLLGSLAQLVKTGLFCHNIQQRLHPVLQGMNRQPVTALLAVRSYDSFFASACSQVIRNEGYRKIDETTKERLLSVSRGWVEVIEEVIRALPTGSQLRIWRFEDFIQSDVAVIAALVGEENTHHVAPFDAQLVPRLSIRCMKRLEELHVIGQPTGPDVVKRMAKKFSKENGFKPYSPWLDKEKNILAKRYDEDVARIRERWPAFIL